MLVSESGTNPQGKQKEKKKKLKTQKWSDHATLLAKLRDDI